MVKMDQSGVMGVGCCRTSVVYCDLMIVKMYSLWFFMSGLMSLCRRITVGFLLDL
ncbi:hypothetical protein RchiOBHm_Chr2g0155041 [Rosa chinensis]|uniref:Uncharacterized protein n=1 Tax=Rosa chinensis TaxID=74649 RepID=A0A2P6S165_ROSCH|nr:hypothetical protein RchiOBHm_Chr2g0155041 [Rosa chinensis]